MRNRLISSLAGAAFSLAASGFVFAADMAVKMPVKAPPPPPAPVYSWTGWYVGGNVGYGWGDANTDLRGNGDVTAPASMGGSGSIFFANPFVFGGSSTAHLTGLIGGGQIGFNYQFSPTGVLGFEADFQGSGERGSGQFADPFVVPLCALVITPSGGCSFFCSTCHRHSVD